MEHWKYGYDYSLLEIKQIFAWDNSEVDKCSLKRTNFHQEQVLIIHRLIF